MGNLRKIALVYVLLDYIDINSILDLLIGLVVVISSSHDVFIHTISFKGISLAMVQWHNRVYASEITLTVMNKFVLHQLNKWRWFSQGAWKYDDKSFGKLSLFFIIS